MTSPSFDIKDAEKNVPWFDLLIPTPDRESVGALQGALGAVCQPQFCSRGHCGRRADGLANLAPAPTHRRPGLDQRSTSRALLVGNKSKEEMLGPDLAVPQTPGLLLGPGDGHARIVTESVQHDQTLDLSG